jgi:predicted PurR-regulated permease PerM
MIPSLLCLYMSLLWVPQIIQNVRQLSTRAPSMGFIIANTIEHLYIPVKNLGYDE